MAVSKIQAESMNLADTYAFTGSVTGAGPSVSTNTFTPVFSSSGATTAYESDIYSAYSAQRGDYLRIGDLVWANAYLRVDTSYSYQNGGADGQTIVLANLPFTVKNVSNYFPSATFGWQQLDGTGWTSLNMMGYGRWNTKYIEIGYAGATVWTSILTTHVKDGDGFIVSIVYETDDA